MRFFLFFCKNVKKLLNLKSKFRNLFFKPLKHKANVRLLFDRFKKVRCL
jgi:hypothetical protein